MLPCRSVRSLLLALRVAGAGAGAGAGAALPGRLLTYPPSSSRCPSRGSHRGGMNPESDMEPRTYRHREPARRRTRTYRHTHTHRQTRVQRLIGKCTRPKPVSSRARFPAYQHMSSVDSHLKNEKIRHIRQPGAQETRKQMISSPYSVLNAISAHIQREFNAHRYQICV